MVPASRFGLAGLLGATFLIGCGYSVVLLHLSAVSGATAFWQFPRGLIGSALDIQNAVSGYYWFAQDEWRWPLLQVTRPNWPEGTNAELFDIVPIAALVGKAVFRASGVLLNPFPAWVTVCFGLNAASMCLLVRSLGARSVAAGLVAAGFGAMAPVVQHRFGHMALMAHWVPIGCLFLYFHVRDRRLTAPHLVWLGLLCALATAIHLYLYVMTAAVAVAVLLQAGIGGRSSLPAMAAGFAAVVLAGLLPLAGFGMLGTLDVAPWTDLSRYSMNVLSPFWPQSSGLFAWTGSYWLTRGSIGATPGQYEGFDYLGGGALLLIVVGLVAFRRDIGRVLRRHSMLALAMFVLLAWALSNQVFVGPYRVVSYPVPEVLQRTVLSWFRSSGRFFWPLGWLLVGLGVAATFRGLRGRAAVWVAAVALLLQLVDVQPWIGRFAQLREAQASPLGSAEDVRHLQQAIADAGSVAVVPPIFCSSDGADYGGAGNVAAMQVQLMAARGNARMPSVYLSRARDYCGKKQDLAAVGVVVSMAAQVAAEQQRLIEAGRQCSGTGLALLCVSRDAIVARP